MPLHIAISGAAGRTGAEVVRACASAEGMRLAAALDAPGSALLGRDAGEVAGIGPLDVPLRDELEEDFDVLVDFSTPTACAAWLEVCASRRRPMVIGTTGHTAAQLEALAGAGERIAIVRSPNMAVGVNLLRRVTRDLAQRMRELELDPDVEIVDVHHRFKRDAPSGTALALAQDVGAGGPEGPASSSSPPIHSLRLGGRPGDHAVHFGLPEETLTLTHSAHSRSLFASGALRAARWVVDRPPGSYDMESVLFGERP